MPGTHPVWNTDAPRTLLGRRGEAGSGARAADERRRERERRLEIVKATLAALRARRMGRG